jgi:hypothetical protein
VADRWYYWHETEVQGPFSANQLAGLAAAGEILPTDTVWKDGVERGVQASRVEHLFPAAPPPTPEPAAPLVSESTPAPALQAASGEGTVAEPPAAGESAAPVEAAPAPRWDARAAPVGRARAVAGKGAIIVGQDGTTVKFRKKCTTCGHEDSSWKTIPITRGTTRVTFFCPKCRKQRQAEINGHTS